MTNLIKQLNEIKNAQQVPTGINLAELSPEIRALVQQEDIIKRLMDVYKKRVLNFVMQNQEHVDMETLNRHVIMKHETQDDLEQIPDGGEVTDAHRTAAIMHPNTARNPIIITMDQGENNATYYWNIRIALRKDYFPDPKMFATRGPEILGAIHIENDLKQIFGEDNVRNFTFNTSNLRGRPAHRLQLTAEFYLTKVNPKILLGVDGNVKQLAKTLTSIGRVAHKSNHDMLGLLKSILEAHGHLPAQTNESLNIKQILKLKEAEKQKYILCGYPTKDIHEKMFFDNDANRWCEFSGTATRFSLNEANEVLEALIDYEMVYSANPEKVYD